MDFHSSYLVSVCETSSPTADSYDINIHKDEWIATRPYVYRLSTNYLISHVWPERRRSSTHLILAVALTFSTCSATFTS